MSDLAAGASAGRSAAVRVKGLLGTAGERMRDLLGELVTIESPSDDGSCLHAMADRLVPLFEPFGRVTRHRTGVDGAPHLVVEVPGQEPSLPHVVVVGHFDTVWPRGTIDAIPWAVDDGIATGPGCFDMKGGLVLLVEALAAMRELGSAPRRPVKIVLSSDEEIGSPTSRPLLDEVARGAGVGLVLESPLPGGALKTRRKGSLIYRIEVVGRAAHSGVEPEKGVSAIVELAHQVLRLHALNEPAEGTVVNIGVITGGSRLNVVPAEAAADVAARVWTAEAAAKVDVAVKSLAPVDPRAVVRVHPGRTRPPMELTPASEVLVTLAQSIAAALDESLGHGATGGGSDANLLAAHGIPVLDGLGPLGGGAHAHDEHVELASMPYRAALLAGLLVAA